MAPKDPGRRVQVTYLVTARINAENWAGDSIKFLRIRRVSIFAYSWMSMLRKPVTPDIDSANSVGMTLLALRSSIIS